MMLSRAEWSLKQAFCRINQAPAGDIQGNFEGKNFNQFLTIPQ